MGSRKHYLSLEQLFQGYVCYSRNKSSSKGDSHLTNRFSGKLSAMRAGCLGLKHCEGSEGRIFFCICVNMGAYHSTKKFKIFEMGRNCKEIPREKFQKIRKLLNFRKANQSTENSGNSGIKVKWNGNFQEKFFKNLGLPHEVVLFSGIYANSQFSTQRQLVFLAAIATASWTSHARMTRIR